MERREIEELLARELRGASAPSELWSRVERAIREPEPKPVASFERPLWAWAVAAVLALSIGSVAWLRQTHEIRSESSESSLQLDLRPYIAPVRAATLASSIPTIYQAPPHFASVSLSGGPVSVGDYQVGAERQARVSGAAVRQVVLSSPSETMALFIAPRQVRVDAGEERWVSMNLAGLPCQRLACQKVKIVRFTCGTETCVLVCKACGEESIRALIEKIPELPVEFR